MTGSVGGLDATAELAAYRYHQAAEGTVLGMNAVPFAGLGQSFKQGQVLEAEYSF